MRPGVLPLGRLIAGIGITAVIRAALARIRIRGAAPIAGIIVLIVGGWTVHIIRAAARLHDGFVVGSPGVTIAIAMRAADGDQSCQGHECYYFFHSSPLLTVRANHHLRSHLPPSGGYL